ncbi:MAG: flagellar brake protein [Steroidobacteraceae bacterium]
MSRSPLDKNAIVVGKPLPFSIYGADNMLLLAQGQLVKTEGMRNALLRGGAYCNRADTGEFSGGSSGAAAREETPGEVATPLDKFMREHALALAKPRPNLRMSREDGSESYPTRIIGMHDRSSMILAAPTRTDKTFVPVFDRQTWFFRALYHTMAIRFQAVVLKAAFEPFPHLHIDVPRMIERKLVRGAPRVPVCLRVNIVEPSSTSAVIVDLSVGGARIAVNADVVLEPMQRVRFTANVAVYQRSIALDLTGTVLPREAGEEGIADVMFHRLQFEPLDDLALLTLEAHINSQLAIDADSFWRLVALGSKQEMV